MAVEQQDLFPIIEMQIERTEMQGMTIRAMFDGMKKMQNDVAEKFEEVKGMVQEVRDSVTLNDAECYDLQKAVNNRSVVLAKDRYEENDGNFKEVVGKLRRFIWKKLKEKFEVARYTHIRRIDFRDAVLFADEFCMEDYL